MKFLHPRSIQTVFSLAFILQLLAPVGVVSYLAWKNSQTAIEQLAEQLMQRTSGRVTAYLKSSMTDAAVIAQNNINAIANGYIQIDQLDDWRPYLFGQLQLSDQIAYVYFGKVNGEYVEVNHTKSLANSDFRYRRVSPETLGYVRIYQLQANGTIDRLLERKLYDPRIRPWYQTGRQANQPVWTNVYQFVSNPRVLGVSLVQNYYDPKNQFQGVFGVDFTLLNLNQILRRSNSLRTGQIFIMERDGTLIATSTDQPPYDRNIKRIKADQLDHPLLRATAQELQRQLQKTGERPSQQTFKIWLDGQLNYARSVRIQDQQGLDWLVVVAMPEADFMQEIWQQRRHTAWLSLCAAIVALATSYWFGRWITRPIVQLSQISQRMANGDFRDAITIRSSQEVNQLAHSFGHMHDELHKNQAALQAQADHLEDQVQIRSIALQQEITARKQTNQVLESTLNQLQTTQEQLVRSAKLAALGEMIAAVAHEMNNPLSTIQHTAHRLANDLSADFTQLPHLIQQLPEHLHPAFFQLFQQALDVSHLKSRSSPAILPAMVLPPAIDAVQASQPQSDRAESDLPIRSQLLTTIAQLTQNQVDDPAKIARKLVVWGMADNIDPFIPLLQNSQGYQMVQMIDNLSTCAYRLQRIDMATNSASKVVAALRSYSRRSQESAMVAIDLLDNIETAITLYHHRIKHQIILNRLYQPVPPVQGAPEELAQVWTNLIQNALYAMPHSGTLSIQVEPIGPDVQVKITDTGCGIPAALQSRVFEPFFTTKPSGEGNGLGLSIVKRIIEQHGGQIALHSQVSTPTQSGGTEFIVKLPIPAITTTSVTSR
jgi:signal transduction histidine kinase